MRKILFIFWALSVFFMGCSHDDGEAEEWHGIKSIDSAGDVGEYSSVAVSGDNIYISFWYATGDDLKFARSADGGKTWTISTVDSSDPWAAIHPLPYRGEISISVTMMPPIII